MDTTQDKEIKIGQYWLVESGDLVIVKGLNDDNTYWIVNKLYANGNFIEDVGVRPKNFERLIDANTAKKISKEILSKKIKTFSEEFDLSLKSILEL